MLALAPPPPPPLPHHRHHFPDLASSSSSSSVLPLTLTLTRPLWRSTTSTSTSSSSSSSSSRSLRSSRSTWLLPCTSTTAANGAPSSSSSSSPPSHAAAHQSQSQDHDQDRFETVELETAGAYRLLDRRTGQHVILWGQPPNLPSSHLLFQSSPAARPQSQSQPQPLIEDKLKAHKVRRMMIRSKTRTRTTTSSPPPPSPPPSPYEPPQLDDQDEDEDEDEDPIDLGYHSPSPSHHSNADRHQIPAASSRDPSLRGWGAAVSPYTDFHYSDLRPNGKEKGRGRGRGKGKGKGSFDAFFSNTSFKSLGCTHLMLSALSALSFLRPSHIQAMAFQPVLQGKTCIIADQSGSGKTLAYLSPLIQRLRQHEEAALAQAKSANLPPSPGCPRVIVLTPTAELASQVLNNCRMISKSGIPFRSMVATGGFKQKTQLDSLHQGLDILIATPGRFLYLYEQGFVKLSHLQS